jgi:hypothetical protein
VLSDWPEAIQLNNSQDRAYIALEESGLDIDGLSDPATPPITATPLSNFVPTASQCPDHFFADEVALVVDPVSGDVDAVISGDECGVVGVDVTNSSNPTFIARIPIPFGMAEEVAVTRAANGNWILYVASYWQGLQIFEVAGDCDSSSCVVNPRGSIGVDNQWGASLAVWVEVVPAQGQNPSQIIAYVASTEGLQIVNVSNPDAPFLIGRLDTNPANIPLEQLDDVPQDVVVAGGLAFVPLWIGGLIVVDVTNPAIPTEFQRIDAAPNTAFFKVEVSSQINRIYVTEGISGLAVFKQEVDHTLTRDTQLPIGEGDGRCGFDVNGVSDVCWAWAIDEVGELVGVTYGVLGSQLSGGYNLISMPPNAVAGEPLKVLEAVPEPHALLLQGVGVLAVAGLGRLRRRRRGA